MRTQLLAALATVLVCGTASAQTTLPSIEVRAGANESVMVSCTKPDTVTQEDVARVLSLEDSSMTRAIHNHFVTAVSQACKAGVAHIQVKSDSRGNVTWKRMK